MVFMPHDFSPAAVKRADPVVVIGAGMGGMAAAVLLAAQGAEVLVLERAAAPGGKLSETIVDGAAIDAGPTVLTMRDVFEQLFADAGSALGDHLTLTPAEILARHEWEGGARLDLFADRARSREAIGALAGAAEARGFDAFCAEARRIHDVLDGPFMRAARTTPLGLSWRIGPRRIGEIMAIRPYEKMWTALGRHFRDPRLRQLFGRYATYCGSSPFQAPATLMLIAHVEQRGVWLVEGGMHRIARALEAVLASHGGRIRYRAPVSEILLDHGRAAGVRLASGEMIAAQGVICNADPAALALGLLGDAARRTVPRQRAADRALSAVTWTIHGAARGFALVRHNVFFSQDYGAEFADLAAGRLPRDPTLYVCAQDRGAADAAAPARERLMVILNAPPKGDAFSPAEIDTCETRMFERLARAGLTITDRAAAIETPADFARRFPGTGGALYGRASHGWAAAFRRPGARTRIPGLYLAGGGVHPGAGLPMAALSGRQAAQTWLADRASTHGFHPAAIAGGMSTR